MRLQVKCKPQKTMGLIIDSVAKSEDGYTVNVMLTEESHITRCKGKGKTLPQAISDCIRSIRSTVNAQIDTDFVIMFTCEVALSVIGSLAWDLLGGA